MAGTQRTQRRSQNTGPFRSNATSVRSSNFRKKVAARRIQRFTRARATAKRNKSKVLSNAKAIKRLQNQLYGPVQLQTSHWQSNSYNISTSHPLIFHVSNFNSSFSSAANRGAEVNLLDDMQHLYPAGHFQRFTSSLMPREVEDVCNGPRCKQLYANYQLKFFGTVPDTNIVVHVIRQKALKEDFQYGSTASNDTKFLPYAFKDFTALAGFTPKVIDRGRFEVMMTKRLRLDTDNEESRTATRDERYMNIHIKLNRAMKQLNTSTNQATGSADVDMSVEGVHANWGWKNIHPFANVWMVISCDHTPLASDGTLLVGGAKYYTNIGENDHSFTASATPATNNVRVHALRRVAWRDRLD